MPKKNPCYTNEIARLHADTSVNKRQIVALRIARMYRHKPTKEALMRDFGMSKATANRWRAAWDYVASEPAAVTANA